MHPAEECDENVSEPLWVKRSAAEVALTLSADEEPQSPD